MFTRPKRGETEEDLLKQQEEFMKQKAKNAEHKRQSTTEICMKECVAEKQKRFRLIGDIIEKKSSIFPGDISMSVSDEGFPKTFKIDRSLKPGKKKSIFAMHLENKKVFTPETLMDTATIDTASVPSKSILTVPESESIHQENVEKLSKMSQEEILEQQRILCESLDANLITFLKNRRKKLEEVENKISFEKMDVDISESEVINEIDEEIIDEKLSKLENFDKKWLDIGVLEKEKLEWIGDIPDVKALDPEQPYSARFDFKGTLLPYTTELDVRQALHHHGSEPERPGYTIQELYQLSRSLIMQQRILAINTVASIIEKAKLGYYDICFDGYLLQKLMDNDLFFLLRFSLDENVESVIAATLNCLHKLICNPVDEVCLDKCLGMSDSLTQPLLDLPVNESETEEGELKDHVVLQLDFVKGVLRTDLLLRFNYILNNFNPSKEIIICILEILIRIVRHSAKSCNEVLKTDLLNVIYRKCLPCVLDGSTYPLYEALKLFRVIAIYSNTEIKYDLLDRVTRYLEIDEQVLGLSKQELYKLQLECFYLWQTIVPCDVFQSYTPIVIRFLNFYIEKVDFNDTSSNFDFDHCTGLLTLICCLMQKKVEPEKMYNILISRLCLKWMNQLLSCEYYKFGMLKALGSVFDFCFHNFEIYGVNESDLISLKMNMNLFSQFLKSNLFSVMLKDLKNHSLILSNNIVPKRDPKNLPSLNTIYQNGENFIETIQEKSTLPFLMSFLRYLLKACNISKDFYGCLNLVLENKILLSYVERVVSKNIWNVTWYLRYEVMFLVTLLKCFYTKQEGLKLGFKLLCIIQSPKQVEDVFNIIFSIEMWENSGDVLVNGCLDNMKSIKNIYHSSFTFENTTTSSEINIFLPIDWMFVPIVNYQSSSSENTDIVYYSLQFIYLMNVFNLFSVKLSNTSKFCRLGCVFLSNSGAFRDDNIKTYLNENLKFLNNEFDFSEDISGISSFYDFYTELLTQYSAVSYGDELFAHYILIPLQNRFDVSFRKLIWFEYLHVLKVITVNNVESKYNMSLKDFVEPMETDQSLLNGYLNNVATNSINEIRNQFVFEVAVQNIRNFINNFETKDNNYYKLFLTRVKSMKNERLKLLLLS